MNKFLILGLILVLSSCGYRINYHASYQLQMKDINSKKTMNVLTSEIVSELAIKYNLMKDEKYKALDTICYYGVPYQYFKFITFQNDSSQTNFSLDYSGVFGKRRQPPYKELLENLGDSIKSVFIVKNIVIKQNSNEKVNKKNFKKTK